LLVKGWSARSGWGFPKGKINKEEPDIDCAVREVMEETGYDISEFVKEGDYIELLIKEQRIRLYIVTGIPEDTHFEPQTRKEISKIKWHYVKDLPNDKRDKYCSKPNNFYLVYPFVGKLHQWIKREKKARYLRKKKENILARHSQRGSHIGESSDVEMSEFDGAVSDSGVRHADYERVTGIIPKQTGHIKFDSGTNYSSDAEATSVLRSVLGIIPEKPPLLPPQSNNEPINVLNSPYMHSPKQMSYTPPTIFQSLSLGQPASGSGVLQSPVQVPPQFPQQYPPLQGQIPLPIQMTPQYAPLAVNSPTLGLATPLAIQPISLPPNPSLYMLNNEGGVNPELLTSPYIISNNSTNPVVNTSMDSYILPQQAYPNPSISLNETQQSTSKDNNDDSLEKKLLDFLNNKTNKSEEVSEPIHQPQGKVLDGKAILRMLNAGPSSNTYESNENNQQRKVVNNKKNIPKSNGYKGENDVNQNSAKQPDITPSNQMLLKLLNENVDEEDKKYSQKNSNDKQQYILGLFNIDKQEKSSEVTSPSINNATLNANQQLQKLFEMQSSGMINKISTPENQVGSNNLEQSKAALLSMLSNNYSNEKPKLLQHQSQPNTLSESSVSLLEMLNKNSASTNDLHSPQKQILKSPVLSSNYNNMKINLNNPNSIPNNVDNGIISIPNMGYTKQSEYKEKGNGSSGVNSGNTSNNNSNSNLSALLMNMLNVSSKPSSPVTSPVKTPNSAHQKNTNKPNLNQSNESSMQLLEKLNGTQFTSSNKNIDVNENLVVNKESSQALLSMLNINSTVESENENKNKQKSASLKENNPVPSSDIKTTKETLNSVGNQTINSLLLTVANKNKGDSKSIGNANSDIVQMLKSSSTINSNNNSQEFKGQPQSKSIDINALFQNAQGNASLAPSNASAINGPTQSPTFTEFSMDSIDTSSIFHFNNDFIKNQRKLKLNEDSRRMMNLLKVNNNDNNVMTKSTSQSSKNPLLDVLRQGNITTGVPTNTPVNEPNAIYATTTKTTTTTNSNINSNNNNNNNSHKSPINTNSMPSSSALNLLNLLNNQSSNIALNPPSSSDNNNVTNNSSSITANNPSVTSNPLLALINGNTNVNSMNTTNNTNMNNNTNPVPTGVSISVQDLFNSMAMFQMQQ